MRDRPPSIHPRAPPWWQVCPDFVNSSRHVSRASDVTVVTNGALDDAIVMATASCTSTLTDTPEKQAKGSSTGNPQECLHASLKLATEVVAHIA